MKRTIGRLSALFSFRVARGLTAALLLASAASVSAQCVSLTTLGSASTQSFNTLSSTAGSTTNNLTITGWFMTETGGGARDNEQYAVDTGGSNTGDTYSYGPAGNTDRALGGLQSGTLIPVIGACFTNNTGSNIGTLDVAYTGEQWRIGNTAAARDDRLDYQYSLDATSLATGTWIDVDALDFTNPIKTAAVAGALDGNAAANRTAISQSIPGLSIANGATFWIRWNDLNAANPDDGLAVDDFSLTPQGAGPVVPALNINDVTLAEGDPPGTTTFTFAVTLTAPAGPGGVLFDIATADGTAQDGNPLGEDNDYVAQSLTGQSIPMGSTGPYNFNVTVNRDTTVEPNQTFFVNVTNITGANAGDVQGQGTITNDDVTIIPIHDIQGPGNSSPIVGASVTTRGIVTGRKTNGFFLQTPDAEVDADPATSQGIFVFTAGAPPAAAAVGALVQVSGTVVEFVPATDPLQPPLTELTGPTVVQLSAGNPLPAAVALTSTFPDPAGPVDQLERLEGMRVSVASLTVGGPTLGNISEPNATATSNGVFYGSVTGVSRGFREPGIQSPDPAPSGSIPPIPRWDANPEVLRVDSDGIAGAPVIDVGTGAVVTGLVGPLDYGFRRYTVLPDLGTAPEVTGGPSLQAVTPPLAQEFTVASYNLQRLYDTVNDPAIGEPVLTPAAFDNRLDKASLAIRDYLSVPDILGVVEVENLATLQALAARINADAVAASQPDPDYVAYLVEGNDVGGIDVGFLVKNAFVVGTTPRVEVIEVVQENAGELFVNPDSSTELLNDRPTLRLNGVIHSSAGSSFPLTVMVNHLRSLDDVGSVAPGSNGWASLGDRVRAKRLAQADSLANLVQARQTGDPAERIVLVGDFNAFEFNDGFVDVIGTIEGAPTPDNETAVPGDGIDLVNPDLLRLQPATPDQRYSYVFDGNAQTLDHVLVNGALLADTAAQRVELARIHADFPETARNDANSPARLSDHDPVVAYFTPVSAADLSITKVESVDPVVAGTNLDYTVTVTNAGPDAAAASWSDTLPPGTSFQALSVPGGWSCTTPAVGAGGSIDCSIASLAPGSAVFTLTIAVDPALASGTVLSNTATVSSTTADPVSGNESATETTTVSTSADLSIGIADAPDPVVAGTDLTYGVTVANDGPSVAIDATWSNALPVGTRFDSLAVPAGWSCITPAVGSNGSVTCNAASLAPASNDVFTLIVSVDADVAAATALDTTATLSSATPEADAGDNSASATTTVATAADLTLSLSDAPDPVPPGGLLTYTLGLTQAGPSHAATVQLSDPLPAGTAFDSLVAPAGWSCTTPAVGATGTVSCTIASLAPGSTSFTLVVAVDPGVVVGSSLSNTATVASATSDPAPAENSATASTLVGSGTADLALTLSDAPDPVVAGSTLTYVLGADNAGPANATDAILSDTLPPGTRFVSLVQAAGWTCTTPAVGAGGTVSCSHPSMPVGSAAFTLVVEVDAGVAGGSVIDNAANLQSSTSDPDAGDNTASVQTAVLAAPFVAISGTKADSGTPRPGGAIVYQIVLRNDGTATQADNPGDEFVDVLPASLLLASASADAGTAVATPGSNTVTWNGSLAPGASVTITIQATLRSEAVPGTTIQNQGTISFDADVNGNNESSTVTDDPGTAGVGDATGFVLLPGLAGVQPVTVPATGAWFQLLLVMLLGGFALVRVGRRVD
jgi:uncharacterized repeat protein (TIGR01451 family)